jgi:predicted alpha/beta-hydrolase family hydrolase
MSEESRPLILFAPGAGAPSTSHWMQAWAARLGGLGLVDTFDYPYRRAGRSFPDRLPKLIEAHGEALDTSLRRHGPRPVVLAGKSMGSRVGCHLATERPGVSKLVCFGYPLLGQGNPDKRRDAVLIALRTPVLFVQGTRDTLCPLPLLAEVRARMTAPSELLVVEDADHSLEVPKARQGEVDAEILATVARFLAQEQAS